MKAWKIIISIALILLFAFICLMILISLNLDKYRVAFSPFNKVRNEYLQYDPFDGRAKITKGIKINGKGVVIKLNRINNSVFKVENVPDFYSLLDSHFILMDLCAQDPSDVKFILYIKYSTEEVGLYKSSLRTAIKIIKNVAVVDWKSKNIIAQNKFFINPPESIAYFPEGKPQSPRVAASEYYSDVDIKKWVENITR